MECLRDFLRQQERTVGEISEAERYLEAVSIRTGIVYAGKPDVEVMLCHAVPAATTMDNLQKMWTFATGPRAKAGEVAQDWIVYSHAVKEKARMVAITYTASSARYRQKKALVPADYVLDAWQVVVSEVARNTELRIRLSRQGVAITFSLAWGSDPLILAMVEEAEELSRRAQSLVQTHSLKKGECCRNCVKTNFCYLWRIKSKSWIGRRVGRSRGCS